MKHPRPNILLIMTDQMRLDALNRGTSDTKYTPNLDWFATQAVQAAHCITNSPICAPARASILAGLYPHQMGIWDNSPHTFPPHAKNWVKALQQGGYRTSVFGKTHYYPYNGSVPDMREAEPLLHDYGYETVDEIPGPRVSAALLSHMTALWEEKGYRTRVSDDLERRYQGKHTCTEPSPLPLELYPDVYVGTKAHAYLDAYHHDDPFFCFVSFGGPHDPWDCPASYSKRFQSKEMEAPRPPFIDRYPNRPLGNWDHEVLHPPLHSEDIEQVRRNYAGKVSLIDDEIGKLFSLLVQKGWWDDTLVLFTSDHGELLGDYNRLYKQNFLGPALEVPFLIKSPSNSQAKTIQTPIALLDIGPTLVDYAHLCLDYPQQGKSLRALLEGTAEPSQTIVFSEYKEEIMAWDGRWKVVVNKDLDPYLLFDLLTDPAEHLNLAGGGLEAEARLRQSIIGHLQTTAHLGFTMEDACHG
ncbi:sulfatase family protein [Sphaerochaeta sp.]|uniref:sulfatase family protein n=1 Tax=Sphaerochaeta sp. TaxID=1972642 RepID=UPI002FC7C0AA